MKKGKDLNPGDPRLLAVNNRVVVPVNTTVRVFVTSGDVIHSWAVPAFGVKKDAIPGHLNETWFKATRTGTFYGQCSEICGVGHGYMPIVVDVVSKDDFDAWVRKMQPPAPASLKPSAGKHAPERVRKTKNDDEDDAGDDAREPKENE
jgi:cytochrome c oxidase subunit 2